MDTEAHKVKKQYRQTIEGDVDNLIGDGRVKQYRRNKNGPNPVAWDYENRWKIIQRRIKFKC